MSEQNDKAKEILASIEQLKTQLAQSAASYQQAMERTDQWVQHLVQAHNSGQISYAHFEEMMDAAIAEGKQAQADIAKITEALDSLHREVDTDDHD
jgi:hypothetical protein